MKCSFICSLNLTFGQVLHTVIELQTSLMVLDHSRGYYEIVDLSFSVLVGHLFVSRRSVGLRQRPLFVSLKFVRCIHYRARS